MAKQKKESVVPPEIIQTLIKEYDIKSVPDIENALKDLFGETLQNLLEAELSNTLGYEKRDSTNKETENRRKGTPQKPSAANMARLNLKYPVTGTVNSNR